MQGNEIAIALRSTVVPPRTIVKLAPVLDQVRSLSHVFLPEGSQGSFQSLDISSACLAVSKRIRVGSGVIRILEHDPVVLANRLLTLQELSDNRFFLGIGAGRPSTDPKRTIQAMLDRLKLTRESFGMFSEKLPRLKTPEVFIAALRRGIAKTVADHTDGLLLNFCPPNHVRNLVRSLDKSAGKRPRVSCYLKIFYSRKENMARRMLIQEFANYDRIPSYHQMFESIGVAGEITSASSALASKPDVQVSGKLLKISLANPTLKELSNYVTTFREAGVDLPCLYPYFETTEEEAFKIEKVEEIIRL